MKIRHYLGKLLRWSLMIGLLALTVLWILLAPHLGLDLFTRGIFGYLLFGLTLTATQSFYNHALEPRLMPLYQAMNLLVFSVTFLPFVGLAILFISTFLLDFQLQIEQVSLAFILFVLIEFALVLAHLSLSRLVIQLNRIDSWVSRNLQQNSNRHQRVRAEVLNRMYSVSPGRFEPISQQEEDRTIHLRKEDAVFTAASPMSERFSRWGREAAAPNAAAAQKPLGKMKVENPANAQNFYAMLTIQPE